MFKTKFPGQIYGIIFFKNNNSLFLWFVHINIHIKHRNFEIGFYNTFLFIIYFYFFRIFYFLIRLVNLLIQLCTKCLHILINISLCIPTDLLILYYMILHTRPPNFLKLFITHESQKLILIIKFLLPQTYRLILINLNRMIQYFPLYLFSLIILFLFIILKYRLFIGKLMTLMLCKIRLGVAGLKVCFRFLFWVGGEGVVDWVFVGYFVLKLVGWVVLELLLWFAWGFGWVCVASYTCLSTICPSFLYNLLFINLYLPSFLHFQNIF